MERLTKQKQVIYDAIYRNRNHPTAEDVYNIINSKVPNISLKTVYRNLNILANNGIILRIPIANDKDRFDPVTLPHYHAYCLKCHAFVDVDYHYDDKTDEYVEKETGFKIFGHNTLFTGICPNCSLKK